jgi:peptidyl-prolyl cis-trans isomerase A (cyclophilin A)
MKSQSLLGSMATKMLFLSVCLAAGGTMLAGGAGAKDTATGTSTSQATTAPATSGTPTTGAVSAAGTGTATGTKVEESSGTKKESSPKDKAAGSVASQPDPKAAKGAEGAASKTTTPSVGTIVEMKTSEGVIKIELADKEAPITVKNFLSYVDDKFYDGLIFHRVIKDFMIQGGGYSFQGDRLVEKQTKAPITNEAKNGLKNNRGTIAMARTADPNSATAQFFINHVNNNNLDYPSLDGHGYAVFGRVLEGMDVVDKIASTPTGMRSGMDDVPLTDIKIISAHTVKPAGH